MLRNTQYVIYTYYLILIKFSSKLIRPLDHSWNYLPTRNFPFRGYNCNGQRNRLWTPADLHISWSCGKTRKKTKCCRLASGSGTWCETTHPSCLFYNHFWFYPHTWTFDDWILFHRNNFSLCRFHRCMKCKTCMNYKPQLWFHHFVGKWLFLLVRRGRESDLAAFLLIVWLSAVSVLILPMDTVVNKSALLTTK